MTTKFAKVRSPGASNASLEQRTLTNLHNERPSWLRNLPARLDREVWNAYDWQVDEVPEEITEEVILERLLTLNLSRPAKQAGHECSTIENSQPSFGF